jgi:hypothetical protein
MHRVNVGLIFWLKNKNGRWGDRAQWRQSCAKCDCKYYFSRLTNNNVHVHISFENNNYLLYDNETNPYGMATQYFVMLQESLHPTTDKVTTHTYEVMRTGGLFCPYHLNPTTMKMLEIGLGCDMNYGLGVFPLLFGRNYSIKLNYGKQNIR